MSESNDRGHWPVYQEANRFTPTPYATFDEAMIAGLRSDAPPPILILYPALLTPLNVALTEHTTLDELWHLRQTAAQQPDTPPAVLTVIDAYIRLYEAIEQL